MSQVVIENPVLNSPFDEPTRHFRFAAEGITNEIADGRRVSSYFVPIARPKKTMGAAYHQALFDTEWTQDRIEENKLVNDIRRRVAMWRKGGYLGVTPTTARLIAYWTDPNREKKLFFCQNEALETAIYITEVAKKYGDAWTPASPNRCAPSGTPGSWASTPIWLTCATGWWWPAIKYRQLLIRPEVGRGPRRCRQPFSSHAAVNAARIESVTGSERSLRRIGKRSSGCPCRALCFGSTGSSVPCGSSPTMGRRSWV